MRRILITRPRDRAEAFAAELSDCGWDPVIWPLTDLRPVAAAQAPADGAVTAPQAVLYTSRAGVDYGFDAALSGAPAFCVGDATADAARRAGHVRVLSAGGDARALIALFRDSVATENGPVLHLRGRDAAGDVGGALRATGFRVIERIVYEAVAAETVPPEIRALMAAKTLDAAAFFSPRASAIFAERAAPEWREALSLATAYAISDNAAEPLAAAGFGRIRIAEEPTASALRAAICGAA